MLWIFCCCISVVVGLISIAILSDYEIYSNIEWRKK